MMKPAILILMFLAVVLTHGVAHEQKQDRYAIILQAGNETNEGMARAVHALLYAQELAEHGYQVALIFDGAATGWAKELSKPENPLHERYLKVKKLGLVEEVCDYCAEVFGVKGDLTEQQKKLLVGEYEGHPSLAKWVEQGYRIIVL
jgi:hypothetical protein